MAKDGYDVTILEKNKDSGGRARQYKEQGFTFDIGPTFYWMPDIFENFFGDFDKKITDFDKLIIGSSIRSGVHHKEIIEFINVRKEELDQIKTAFFSVNSNHFS